MGGRRGVSLGRKGDRNMAVAATQQLAGLALALDNLPPVTELIADCRAEADVVLPPLPTTSLRGALLPALRDRAPALLEHPGRPLAGAGVTDRAPAALVLAPDTAAVGRRRFELSAGERLAVRLVLIGERAATCADAVVAALRVALAGGIGRARGGGGHVPFALRDVSPAPARAAAPAPARARIQLVTPARIVHGGRVCASLDGAALVAAAVRRADLLARVHGGGRLVPPGRVEPAIDTLGAAIAVAPVRRYSSRQGRAMTWPGLIGHVDVGGPDLPAAWPAIEFAARAGIGKATTFGFGRLSVSAAPDAGAAP
ncbi:MAG: CRISPR system precrRNA processing endoribonuclease RAMP protein Cas6 [Deltaproteobacteria bacterium]|nr:MAG: CRISPR system precrRNA processing endoribonuclease RAMP protein Cas6 [Deltaproteobacteria bacterium]